MRGASFPSSVTNGRHASLLWCCMYTHHGKTGLLLRANIKSSRACSRGLTIY